MNPFANMVAELTETKSTDRKITHEEFEQWQREYSFNGLKNLRYGQSFCQHFAVRDNLIYFAPDPESVDNYVRQQYIQ